MIFIDGSNLLCEISRRYDLGYTENYKPPPASLLTLADTLINRAIDAGSASFNLIRSYWFGSIQGDDASVRATEQRLRELKYEPRLIKKPSAQRLEKGVDLALGIEMLVHAFHQNYDIGILIAGDKDYVQLVDEVKRFGQVVWGMFFATEAIGELPFDEFREIQSSTSDAHDTVESLLERVRQDLDCIRKGGA